MHRQMKGNGRQLSCLDTKIIKINMTSWRYTQAHIHMDLKKIKKEYMRGF